MKYLILAMLVMVGCSSQAKYPLIIKEKMQWNETDCRYNLYTHTLEDSWFKAPCDKWVVGDTLK